ncbi:MAG: exosortase F system-associated protein [Cyclobacteriaceae bacterium]|nr:exosortase F system-associated protein [Cyclobacteriaceae bacterium]
MKVNKRAFYITLAVVILIAMYLLQRINYSEWLFSNILNPNWQFIVNRSIRFIVNDLAVILLIYAIFNDRELIKIAFIIQFFELAIILPLYFYFKLSLEGPSEISSPLLSFVHRIVVNPIIMLLLIPAFWFQKKKY